MWLRKGAEALSDNPAAHSNVLFTLVGYELEPAAERWPKRNVSLSGLANTPLSAGAIGSPTPSPATPENRLGLSGLLPPRGELFRRAPAGAMESTDT